MACIASPFLFAQAGVFEILKGGHVVGRIDVDRSVQGASVAYSMTSLSTINLIWDQVVRTVVKTHYSDGRISACMSTMHVNTALRDSSSLSKVAGRGLYFVHPRTVFADVLPVNPWTTARMYFEEPVGQTSIFVESALADCPMERIAAGEYRLRLPNKDCNIYIYQDGLLQEIRVDRSWVDLVFRRVG